MQELFGADGRLATTLAGFEPRAGQAALAQAVADSLDAGEHLLAEAGTGTGKSLAYLLPALASGKRVVVATATKALQDQLVTKDVPAAAAGLGRGVRCALLKGRENYLCLKSLQGLELLGGSAGALFRTPDDALEFERLRDWIEATETGDRAELPFEPSPSLWLDLAVGGDRCSGRRCPLVGACFSEAARGRAAEAELVVTNHALYFADLALRSRLGTDSVVLPEHDAVVFDEAHRLEDAAATWLGGRVSLAGLRRLARDVERSFREVGTVPPTRALAELDRLGGAVIGALDPGRGRRRLRAREVDRALERAIALVEALSGLARALAGGGEERDLLARRALASADDLETCLAVDDPDLVSWSEPGALVWAPVDVSRVLREALWGDGATAILVSATLEAPLGESDWGGVAGFPFLRGRLGLDDAREIAFPSPYDYREQALLYVPAQFPEPRTSGYVERLAAEVIDLCRLSRGRALVLTTSYRTLEELGQRLDGRLPYTLLRQGDAPRERLLARFRSEVDSVLLATQTFWQGVDVPGESLSLLVIEKLPFAVPDDPLVEARCERIAGAGRDPFIEYSLPAAVLQLRQGFGRLIRSHGDCGVVAILDPRLRTRAYGRRFLGSLPPCPLVSSLDDVAEFFAAAAIGVA